MPQFIGSILQWFVKAYWREGQEDKVNYQTAKSTASKHLITNQWKLIFEAEYSWALVWGF